jgi:cytoskeleton protein RodZ
MDDHFEQTDVSGPGRVGERLAAARKARKLAIADVSEQTRIPTRFLDMIEAGVQEGLPAPPYSVGFVRSYARVVGLDPAEIARDFRSELDASPVVRTLHTPFEPVDPARVPSRALALVAVAVALIIALVYALWRVGMLSGDSADDRARLAAGTMQEAAAPALAPAVPAAKPAMPATAAPSGPVVLTALEPVWVRVYEPGGERLIEETLAVGQRYEVPESAVDPRILTGRPQALRITVGSVEIPPLGPPERTVRDVSLLPDALRARATTPPPPAPQP